MIYEKLLSTSYAQVLRFLARRAGQSFYEREIVEDTDVSRSAVNLACNALYQAGLLTREQRGRMNFYAVADRHPFVRQFKVLDTIARLEPLLAKLQPLSRRIVLFGSCAKGEYDAESDIDLCIIGSETKLNFDKFKLNHKIQLFFFSKLSEIPKNLKQNIINGVKLYGFLR